MLHYHSGIGKFFGFLIYFIQSLAAIIIGLYAFKIDVFALPYVQTNLQQFIYPTQIVFGVAGVLGLLFLFFGCKRCNSH